MAKVLGQGVVKDLRVVCQELVGSRAPQAFASQIHRVLCHITSNENLQEIRTTKDVIAAFRRKGHIPPSLVDVLGEITPTGCCADTGAICFAASIYPHRSCQIGTEQLRQRIDAFQAICNIKGQPVDALTACLPNGISPEDVTQLVEDLSAADVGRNVAEQEDRRAGSALYLLTCSKEEMLRIHRNWCDDGTLVRHFRKWLLAVPSILAGQDVPGRNPDWDNVRQWLAERTPMDVEHREKAVILEIITRKKAEEWISKALVSQEIVAFWDFISDRLTCGFPYYAFRSHFVRWWQQYLANYRFTRKLPSHSDRLLSVASGCEPGAAEHTDYWGEGLSPEQLRWFREGFRLVRATFFRRADKKIAKDKGAIAVENERVRKILDHIWTQRLERRMAEEDQLPPVAMKTILKQHPEINSSTIHVLCRRLRLRIWAYALGRLGQLRNSQILSARRPGKPDEHPLSTEPGILTVASLAKAVPLDNSFIWAFTSHVFLYPRIVQQRPDPWTFPRYVQELWSWVSEETFCEAIERGAEQGNPPDRIATGLMQEGALKQLIEDLRKLPGPAEAESCVQGRSLREEERLARENVLHLIGPDRLDTWDSERFSTFRTHHVDHWVVPVWYLTVVEQSAEEKMLARLQIDKEEIGNVRALRAAMLRYRSPKLADGFQQQGK